MILLIDLGNHRLKWQLRPHAEAPPVRAGGAGWDADWRASLKTDLRAHPPERALVACVAGPGRRGEIQRLLEESGISGIAFPSANPELGGVHNGYRDPSRLGIDRWCAAVAAYRRCRSAVLVADAGTAWTYDAVDATGQHRGGWIAPGSETQRRSLESATAALPYFGAANPTAEVLPPDWGQDTEAAIRGGVRAMLSGFLAIAEQVARQCLGSAFARVATGGDQEALRLLAAHGYTIVEDLVLEGLALYGACEHGTR